jgi:hypothetical protein
MAKPIPRIGRSVAFSDPDELLDWFYDYIDDCIDNNSLASVAGFRSNKSIPRSTYYDYVNKPEFSDCFAMINDILEDKTINNNSVDGSTKKLILQSKFGYKEKSEVSTRNVNTTLDELKRLSDAELQAQIDNEIKKLVDDEISKRRLKVVND